MKLIRSVALFVLTVFASTALAQAGRVPPSNLGAYRVYDKSGQGIAATYFGYPMDSLESLEFFDTVEGANVNTNLWQQSVSTMTITQTSSFISVNPTASVVSGAYAILQTVPSFFDTSCIPLHFHFTLTSSLWNLPANVTVEYGWGSVSGVSAPTDGVFVRVQNGARTLVSNNGGTETSVSITDPLPTINSTFDNTLNVYGNLAQYKEGNNQPWEVDMTGTQGALVSTSRQSFFVRVYNSGVPTSSPVVGLGQISIQQRNAQFNKPYAAKLAGMGRGSHQSPVTTFVQTTSWANSTEPALAALSNTTAGYTTIDGQWAFAAVAGAATDYVLFAYQVPVGYQFYITEVVISTMNGAINGGAAGAAVATTPTIMQWAIGLNSSAASLATADGAGTWAPRRVPICTQGFQIGAGVGATATDCFQTFFTPKVVDGNRFVDLILRMPIATNTASQVLRGTYSLRGYYE